MAKPQRIGKSQARAKFLPLVDAVAAGRGPIEITDHGKVAAVLLGHDQYLRLLAKAGETPTSTRSPFVMTILGDLDEGSASAAEDVLEAVRRTTEE